MPSPSVSPIGSMKTILSHLPEGVSIRDCPLSWEAPIDLRMEYSSETLVTNKGESGVFPYPERDMVVSKMMY